MDTNRPYQPAPEFQYVLNHLERIGHPVDQMTRDNVADLWLQREVLAARVLAPIPLTAGCDVLRDEGRAYADRLEALGVHVVYRLEPELIHAGLNLVNSPFFPDASRRVEPIVESLAHAIRAAWAG
jgi:acetyl esterase/lipase